MIAALALLAASAAAMPVWEAERAFAAQAQREGTWTAFRANTAANGVMFAPKMVRTLDYLGKAKDPPPGYLQWLPSRALTACDGSIAFSTGPWVRPGDRAFGTFSTIWQRQPDGGWKWRYDSGRDTPGPVRGADRIADARPVCRNLPHALPPLSAGQTTLAALAANAGRDLLVQEDDRMPAAVPRGGVALDVGAELVGGASDDRSLVWSVADLRGAKDGAHMLRVWAWDGARYRIAVIDVIGAG